MTHVFPKTITKTVMKANKEAFKFANGDISVTVPETVKGQPSFGYYTPTTKGFTFVNACWSGKQARQYNWAKVNNPAFVA